MEQQPRGPVTRVELTIDAGLVAAAIESNHYFLLEYDSLDGAQREKQVYACYGYAMMKAQGLETTFSLVRVAFAGATRQIKWRHEVDGIFADFEKKTFGSALKEIRKHIHWDNDIDILLHDGLSKRNELAHGFFYRNASAMISNAGKRKIVANLVTSIGVFEAADFALTLVERMLRREIGITDDDVRKIYDEMHAEALLPDVEARSVSEQ